MYTFGMYVCVSSKWMCLYSFKKKIMLTDKCLCFLYYVTIRNYDKEKLLSDISLYIFISCGILLSLSSNLSSKPGKICTYYNGQKFREMRISHYVMRNIISRNIQCEFRKAENKAFLCVSPLFSSIFFRNFPNTI